MARRPTPLLADHTAERTVRQLVTPEGVAIHLTVAALSDRIVAFLIDVAILCVAITVIILLALFSLRGDGTGWVLAFTLLVTFLIRNFYFMFFELRWQGATPGKRICRMRVVDVHGGQLTAEAVIARNLTRDLELFIPLTLSVAPQVAWPNAPGWLPLLTLTWMFTLTLMPLFNRNRQRVGDLIGGTMVILAPRMELLADLVRDEVRPQKATDTDHHFTDKQLSLYGIYELQVLERVLRQPDPAVRSEMMIGVSSKIQEKIGWQGGVKNDKDFLMAFYAALRARLERKMLLGKRRQDKFGPPE